MSIQQFPCSVCGGQLNFKPGIQKMECIHCGSQQEITATGQIREHDYEAALNNAPVVAIANLSDNAQEVKCSNCGAQIMTDKTSEHCPFCDSVVVVNTQSQGIIAPESVLPFKIDANQAKESFQKWLSSRWFAPGDLVSRARKDGLNGVYLPYWTYDSQSNSRYKGKRGEYYYEEESYEDASGDRKTRRVRKTEWHSVKGRCARDFDDVLICSSKSLPQNIFDGLKTWKLEELKPFNGGYLSGFLTERYGISLKEGFDLAKKKMEDVIRSDVKCDIGGDDQKIDHIDTQYLEITYKHILLPLWISSFRYNDKVYRFIVNAQTGEATGERPFSMIKIIMTIVFIVAIIVAIVKVL